MANQYVEAAFVIIFLIAAVIAMHALFVLLFRPGRRKAAALRLAGALIGPFAMLIVFMAVTTEVPEMTPTSAVGGGSMPPITAGKPRGSAQEVHCPGSYGPTKRA